MTATALGAAQSHPCKHAPWALALVLLTLTLGPTPTARAQSPLPSPADSSAASASLPLWEVGIGAGLMRLPHYRGSDQTKGWLLPLPYAVYRGAIFKADRDGARAELLKSNDWRFDLSIAAGAPTNSKDNMARAGMKDLSPTLEFGPNFIWTVARSPGWSVEARVPVRTALTLSRNPRLVGLVTTPNLNVDVVVNGWDVGAYIGPVFATRRQNAYYYDVPADAATASRPAYQSSGGYAGSQLVFGTSRRFGTVWVGAFGKYDMLKGAAFDDSPLVRQKSNFAFGVGLSWVFWQSQQRAATPEPAPSKQ